MEVWGGGVLACSNSSRIIIFLPVVEEYVQLAKESVGGGVGLFQFQ